MLKENVLSAKCGMIYCVFSRQIGYRPSSLNSSMVWVLFLFLFLGGFI